MSNDSGGPAPQDFTSPKGGLFGSPFNSSSVVDPNVRALIMDHRWTTTPGGDTPATVIKYAFPQQATDYSVVAGYPNAAEIASFRTLTDAQKAAVVASMSLVSTYTQLKFEVAGSALAVDATFRIAGFNDGGSQAGFPTNRGPYSDQDSRDAGDQFLGGNGTPASMQFFGTDDFNTIMHEMGHSFGLKHGHDATFNGGLAPGVNDNEFSVMTYASYFGADTEASTTAILGSAPQSYMMYDIAALQALYRPNFDRVGRTDIYKWDPVTGRQSINDQPAPNTGVTATNKIFSTVWTQGAIATYDLSAFSGDQVNDLRPGKWLTFSRDQLADLNSDAPAGTAQYQAQGNIYNALLHDGDLRSAIANLISGSGNDTLIGNDLGNELRGNAGNDIIEGGAGDDALYGGDGNDTLRGGTGQDIFSGGPGADIIEFASSEDLLRDTWADMQSDTITGFRSATSVDILGSLVGRSNLQVTMGEGSATLSAGGMSLVLGGDFVGGDFIAAARGTGEAAHTTVTYASFLPTLREGVQVNPALVNGVVAEAFLRGDDSVRFTLEFKSASSAYANALGIYEIAANGTLTDVRVLFANTKNVAPAAQTVDLGVLGTNERLGFFLVQDGFTRFGDLPGDLSFVAPGSTSAATLDAGLPPSLFSTSRGALDGAAVFHSFSTLNPGDRSQVLSGVSPGGLELLLAFEDLPGATGDNDFQDVVIGIRTNADGLLFV